MDQVHPDDTLQALRAAVCSREGLGCETDCLLCARVQHRSMTVVAARLSGALRLPSWHKGLSNAWPVTAGSEHCFIAQS